MLFVDDLKWAVRVMLHPDENSKETMDSIAGFIRYYKASLIPLLAVVIIEILLSSVLAATIAAFLNSALMLLSSSLPYHFGTYLTDLLSSFVGIVAAILLILGTIFFVWIAVPISLFVNSMIYHIVGKYVFRVFKGEYDNTASAFVYSAAPFMVLGWTIVIPGLNIILIPILVGWQLTILVYSMANQESITKKMAGIVIFGIGIIAAIIALITGI